MASTSAECIISTAFCCYIRLVPAKTYSSPCKTAATANWIPKALVAARGGKGPRAPPRAAGGEGARLDGRRGKKRQVRASSGFFRAAPCCASHRCEPHPPIHLRPPVPPKEQQQCLCLYLRVLLPLSHRSNEQWRLAIGATHPGPERVSKWDTAHGPAARHVCHDKMSWPSKKTERGASGDRPRCNSQLGIQFSRKRRALRTPQCAGAEGVAFGLRGNKSLRSAAK
jgi:hypothetical protein